MCIRQIYREMIILHVSLLSQWNGEVEMGQRGEQSSRIVNKCDMLGWQALLRCTVYDPAILATTCVNIDFGRQRLQPAAPFTLRWSMLVHIYIWNVLLVEKVNAWSGDAFVIQCISYKHSPTGRWWARGSWQWNTYKPRMKHKQRWPKSVYQMLNWIVHIWYILKCPFADVKFQCQFCVPCWFLSLARGRRASQHCSHGDSSLVPDRELKVLRENFTPIYSILLGVETIWAAVHLLE